VLPSDRGHFNYAMLFAERLSDAYAVEVFAPHAARVYSPPFVSFHNLTALDDTRFDRMTRLFCAMSAHGSDPDPHKACDEANAYVGANIEEAIGEEFAADPQGAAGIQGTRENLIELKERVLRPDVALCIFDAVHFYKWVGDHCKEFGVPSLALCCTPLYLWRPADETPFPPDNLGVEPEYKEVRKDKDKVRHSKCYTLLPAILPEADAVPTGIVTGPVLCPTETGVPRDQQESFASSALREWMDASDKPIVYISLGSMLKGYPLIETIWTKLMREAADATRHRTLYSGWMPPGMGPQPGEEGELRCESWVPQAAVLAHPNTKAFVSHCGATSLNEAIFHQVPMIALPFFHDQRFNGKKLVEIGAATACLMKDTFDPAEARAAIAEALTSPRVRKTMKQLSDQIKACCGLEKVTKEAEKLIQESKL